MKITEQLILFGFVSIFTFLYFGFMPINSIFYFGFMLINIGGASNRLLEERHFWVREARNSQAELDFIFVSRNHGIVPVEVKSSDSARLKSLHLFMNDSTSKIAIRFWGYYESRNKIRASSGKKFTLFNLPYYYAGFIDKYLEDRHNENR